MEVRDVFRTFVLKLNVTVGVQVTCNLGGGVIGGGLTRSLCFQ